MALHTKSIGFIGVAFIISGCASASDNDEPLVGLGGKPFATLQASAESAGLLDTVAGYRLGDEFGKKPVTAANVAQESAVFQRAAKATARVGGATGFYLGRYNDVHLMATNHHVLTSLSACNSPRSVVFPVVAARGTCTRVLGSYPNVDIAIFEVKFASAADEAKVVPFGVPFAWDRVLRRDTPLVTFGFGVAGNPTGQLTGNQDSDCRIFSKDGEYRLMGDPDTANPADYEAWSFAMACDGSHGDSGSSMVDRRDGALLGILWTGKTPKIPEVQTSAGLSALEASNGSGIWTELNYAVPAPRIGAQLDAVMADPATPASTRTTFAALRAAGSSAPASP